MDSAGKCPRHSPLISPSIKSGMRDVVSLIMLQDLLGGEGERGFGKWIGNVEGGGSVYEVSIITAVWNIIFRQRKETWRVRNRELEVWVSLRH
ncbi:hypothetical protein K435DRAFT_272394 [Dendrothele bispora CBS 962.96]|uniref:Uncharacterized protein n=1 Tax=Dendrothele bispora (strain CBS 962.96) TaxID=1314807 RepID=A0A4S8LMQ2_DENBC|nr:hypothetical protein K435DRAFT_141410 [Dendrothele bispora CBS 962.96]THU90340.1 hypothetical protein K435DRAFT_272394 [Dendrothele bispora CBS 962.96]